MRWYSLLGFSSLVLLVSGSVGVCEDILYHGPHLWSNLLTSELRSAPLLWLGATIGTKLLLYISSRHGHVTIHAKRAFNGHRACD